ncbi:MAG: formylglycine-generating enzyme family protein, partial [Planctomycetota bacterium]
EELGSVARVPFGQRRANAAATLLRLGEREKVVPVFKMTDDPEAMTQFIFRCRPRGVGIDSLLELFDLVSAAPRDRYPLNSRYALLLSLGEFALDDVPEARLEALLSKLADWYANDPSSGVHGASGWLLRHWGQTDVAKKVDQTPVPYSRDREWFTLAITVTPTSPPSEPLPTQTFYYTFIVFREGEYTIGSVSDEPERAKDENEETRHAVKLSRPFALLDREITLEELIAFSPQHDRFMQQAQAQPSDAGYQSNWYDSVRFCRWLGEQFRLPESDQAYADPASLDRDQYPRDTSEVANSAPKTWPLDMSRRGFRLPTEAEWEIAARSGARTIFGCGSDASLLNRFGWFVENSVKRVHRPKERIPSVRGLWDLHGNVFEWTHDWFTDYASAPPTDPTGPSKGSNRVFRGGGCLRIAAFCRSSDRNARGPTYGGNDLGFRLALSPVEPPAADK